MTTKNTKIEIKPTLDSCLVTIIASHVSILCPHDDCSGKQQADTHHATVCLPVSNLV